MSDGMSDRDRGTYSFSGPLKTATPGKRPGQHRDSVRRERAKAAFVALLEAASVQPWVRERLASEAFLQRGRADDYEALIELLRALGAR